MLIKERNLAGKEEAIPMAGVVRRSIEELEIEEEEVWLEVVREEML